MRYLLVDAHSVIFAWPELRALHAQRMALARDELIKRLTHFQDVSDYRVVAVFDGQGAKHSDYVQSGGIQIFYSSSQQTADAIIERLVAKYGADHDLTVVSNDRMELQTANSFGAFTLSVELFLLRLADAEGDFRKELKRLRRRL